MAHLPDTELRRIGRKVAGHIMGPGKVKRVDVVTGQDSTDQPAHYFSFLLDQDRDRQVAALLRTRLAQKLRDELLAHDDPGYPFIRILSQQDWDKRERA